MTLLKGIKRETKDLKAEYDALVQALGTEDAWFTFRRKGKAFIQARTKERGEVVISNAAATIG